MTDTALPTTAAPARSGSRGGSLIILGQLGRMVIQLLGVAALSRILSPEDFGLIAMITVFMALGDLIRDFGIPTAALQKPKLTHQQASNAFWMNTTLGLTAAALLTALTPVITSMFDEPRLADIVPAMAGVLIINGVQAQIQVHLARSMKFGTLAATDVAGQAAGLTFAILLALHGWGYWALVVQALVAAASTFVLRAILARWLPYRPRRGHGAREMLRNGTDLGLAQLVAFIANNTDTVAIGIYSGATSLGYYNRGFQFYYLPRAMLLEPLTQVIVPTITRQPSAQADSASGTLFRAQRVLGVATVWSYLILAVTAAWLVPLVLGDQWGGSVSVARLLAIGGSFAAFGNIAYWALLVKQLNRQLLYLSLVTKTIFVILVLVAAPHGVAAVAAAYSLAQAIAWPVNMIWLRIVSGFDAWRFTKDGLRPLAAGAASFFASAGVLSALHIGSRLGNIGIGICIATLLYAAIFWALPGGRQCVQEILEVAARILHRGRADDPDHSAQPNL